MIWRQQLKKTSLKRYSLPMYNSMYTSFLNRFPIKPNLIYINNINNDKTTSDNNNVNRNRSCLVRPEQSRKVGNCYDTR